MNSRINQQPSWQRLRYAPGPNDNPLKGFMPFAEYYNNSSYSPKFPHSMEWLYIPLSDVMNGHQSFTFTDGLDPYLEAIASRGHQVALRIFVDYPAREGGLPQFLRDEGVQVRQYDVYGGGECPDYSNPILMNALIDFITAFGERYDGDARIGFVTVGLIGFWGEWHTYPYNGEEQPEDWMPSQEWQQAILNTFTTAFPKTKLLVRTPIAASLGLPIGYHDDSFAYSTLYAQPFFFMQLVEDAGVQEKWRTCPIGGELRPELQNGIWDVEKPAEAEDFSECVLATHASWLINQGVFRADFPSSGPNFDRALAAHRQLGYEFSVERVRFEYLEDSLSVGVEIRNRGVAPFYYDWDLELGFLGGLHGELAAVKIEGWRLSQIMPGDTGQTWTIELPCESLPNDYEKILMRVKNPMQGGKPLRFSNEEQDQDFDGWVTLLG